MSVLHIQQVLAQIVERGGIDPVFPSRPLVRSTRRTLPRPLRLPGHRHLPQVRGRERRRVEVGVEQGVPGRHPLRRVVLDEALEERMRAGRRVWQQPLQRDGWRVGERDLGVVGQVC